MATMGDGSEASFTLGPVVDGVGMDWMTVGGRRHLALRMLAEVLDEYHPVRSTNQVDTRSFALHEQFADEFVSKLPEQGGELQYDDVLAWTKGQ